MSSEKIASAQNGYAGMKSNWAIAFTETITMPAQRATLLPAQMPKATKSWTTPMSRTIQPHILRSLKMYLASLMKKLDFETAAMPSMMLKIATITIITPTKVIQPPPATSSPYVDQLAPK